LRSNQLRTAQNYGVTRWQLFAWVVLPATMAADRMVRVVTSRFLRHYLPEDPRGR